MKSRTEHEKKISEMKGIGFGTAECDYWKIQFELLLDIRDLLNKNTQS